MTISVIQEVEAENTAGAASIGVAVTCLAGESLHIIVSHGNTTAADMAATPITNSGTAISFSAALDNVNDAADEQRIVHYYANGVPAQTTTITANFSSGSATFRAIKIKRIGGTSGYDAVASAHAGQLQATPTTSADAVSSGNTPTLSAQPALISAVTAASAAVSTSSVGTGFTNDQATGWQFGSGTTMSASESKRVTATTALAGTFTAASNDARLTVAAVFLESAAADAQYFQAFGLRRNRPGIGPYSLGRMFRRRAEAFTLIGDVSIALGGQQITAQQGTVTPSIASVVSGSAVTLAAGTISPAAATSLSGSFVTLAQGLVSAGNDVIVPLSGQSLTVSAGALAPALSGALTGGSVTFAQGTISAGNDITVALSGQSFTASAGTLIAALAKALSGQDITFAHGTISAGNDITVALTGQGFTASTGTLAAALARALSGQAATFAQGTVTPDSPSDTTPDAFAFTDQSGVGISSTITSAAITITGINAAADITVSGGTYNINGGAFTAVAGTVVDGDEVQARHTSSASYLTLTSTTVTIGGVSDTFSSTTRSEPASGGGEINAPVRMGGMMIFG